jgi:hypothetical protein
MSAFILGHKSAEFFGANLLRANLEGAKIAAQWTSAKRLCEKRNERNSQPSPKRRWWWFG